MEELEFRPRAALEPSDHHFLESVGARVFAHYSRDPRSVVRAMSAAPGALVEVARAWGEPVGFFVVGITRLARPFGPWERPATAHLDAIAVEPALQGAGLGTKLLARAEVAARSSGAVGMSLMTAFDNHRARRMFASAGYRAIVSVNRAYTADQPAVVMMKLLDQPALVRHPAKGSQSPSS
jgi:ribosomal protein S18 acetylase RimI-like enzyme